MALRRLLGVLMLVVATSAALVGPASADTKPYGPKPGSITVSKTVVTQGHTVHVRADGFCANATVQVTVTAGDSTTTFSETTGKHGVVTTDIRLTHLGTNTITISGCRMGGGRQTLTATVKVVPHRGKAHVSHSKVHKGDRVRVAASVFCPRARVIVKVLDDGREYKRLTLHSDRHGRVSTMVRLTRAGRTTLIMQGCRAKGGTQAYSATVKVSKRTSHSFSASPVAFVGAAASGAPAAAYAGLAGGLLVLFLFGQLLVGRRRRSQ